ncbi:MAG: hypothetical protein M0D55_11545 [Elusimicrobiota bacterium]|nr:MAG: hypothetical protein M0D55_11545 [Elusimicrobiota bacterium]
MAKKTPAPANGNGAEGPLKTLKSVYDFMVQNGLDAVEITEDGAQVKLVRRKANVQQVAVPVPVAAGARTRLPPRPPLRLTRRLPPPRRRPPFRPARR